MLLTEGRGSREDATAEEIYVLYSDWIFDQQEKFIPHKCYAPKNIYIAHKTNHPIVCFAK